MLYRDIFNKLMRQSGLTQAAFAEELGLNSQTALAGRPKDSSNPGMADVQRMLSILGYEVAFVPKGTLERNAALAEVCYVPELPVKEA